MIWKNRYKHRTICANVEAAIWTQNYWFWKRSEKKLFFYDQNVPWLLNQYSIYKEIKTFIKAFIYCSNTLKNRPTIYMQDKNFFWLPSHPKIKVAGLYNYGFHPMTPLRFELKDVSNIAAQGIMLELAPQNNSSLVKDLKRFLYFFSQSKICLEANYYIYKFLVLPYTLSFCRDCQTNLFLTYYPI